MEKRALLSGRLASNVIAFLLLFLTGLALTRLLYEAAFPRLLALAQPGPVLLLAFLFAIIGLFLWRTGNIRPSRQTGGITEGPLSVWTLTPLLLNLIFILDPAVDLINSRFIFAASVWLTAVFIAQSLTPLKEWRWLGLLFIVVALLPLYLLTIPQAVGAADTFEFQVVIPQLGIAHPTGYPLYILVGRLFAFIPIGSMAWRINLASAVFMLLAVSLVYTAGLRLLKRPVPALLAAVLLGLTPVVWSQAIEAEVYALHALFIAAGLWLMVVMVESAGNEKNCSQAILAWPSGSTWQRLVVVMAFLLGLGLTNHLTTLFLLPPALLAVLLAYGNCLRHQSLKQNLLLLLKAAAAFLFPLLLYAYLPLRWSALHDEAMGLARFVDWVIGGRFQGALQLTAWLTDMTRYQVVGRLLLSSWGWLNLVLIALGLIYLLLRSWRFAAILLLTWLGFIFYALNYMVPDLAVFIIPAHIVSALFWGAGVTAVLAGITWLLRRWKKPAWETSLGIVALLLLLLPSLMQITENWPAFNDNREKLLTWGQGVLALPLEDNAAILADSEKIAPLYYLQQAEGVRPDLEIMVLPDEASYRAELDARIAAGQTVYLARFLPGLEGIYHLRSFGPLIEVSTQGLEDLPPDAIAARQVISPLELAGYIVQEQAAVDPASTGVTLFWEAERKAQEPLHVYLRWAGDGFVSDPDVKTGQHPAANYYPIVAWREGEIVSDFHLLSRPISDVGQTLDLQVAVGPSFSSAETLDWQTITQMTMPASSEIDLQQTLRTQYGRILLNGVEFPPTIQPQTALPVVVSGYGHNPRNLQFSLISLDTSIAAGENEMSAIGDSGSLPPFVYATEVDTDLPNGRYSLISSDSQATAVCGWLARPSSGCVLGEVQISGVPLPEGAKNYEDKIALLEIEIPNKQLQPGGQLPVNLHWQSLSPMDEDYTVFLQVLDAQDQIVGQVDAWPLHGTYATSQWAKGEIINDPHLIQLDGNLSPGPYRLHVGWYLLSTLGRLPVLDDNGLPVDDKFTVSDLLVP